MSEEVVSFPAAVLCGDWVSFEMIEGEVVFCADVITTTAATMLLSNKINVSLVG